MRRFYKWLLVDSKPSWLRLVLVDTGLIIPFSTYCAITGGFNCFQAGIFISGVVTCIFNLIMGTYTWTYFDLEDKNK